jgi:hypothetical protein
VSLIPYRLCRGLFYFAAAALSWIAWRTWRTAFPDGDSPGDPSLQRAG